MLAGLKPNAPHYRVGVHSPAEVAPDGVDDNEPTVRQAVERVNDDLDIREVERHRRFRPVGLDHLHRPQQVNPPAVRAGRVQPGPDGVGQVILGAN